MEMPRRPQTLRPPPPKPRPLLPSNPASPPFQDVVSSVAPTSATAGARPVVSISLSHASLRMGSFPPPPPRCVLCSIRTGMVPPPASGLLLRSSAAGDRSSSLVIRLPVLLPLPICPKSSPGVNLHLLPPVSLSRPPCSSLVPIRRRALPPMSPAETIHPECVDSSSTVRPSRATTHNPFPASLFAQGRLIGRVAESMAGCAPTLAVGLDVYLVQATPGHKLCTTMDAEAESRASPNLALQAAIDGGRPWLSPLVADQGGEQCQSVIDTSSPWGIRGEHTLHSPDL